MDEATKAKIMGHVEYLTGVAQAALCAAPKGNAQDDVVNHCGVRGCAVRDLLWPKPTPRVRPDSAEAGAA